MGNGLLVYTPLNGRFNIGDYIQSLAAKQYFNKGKFVFIDRDHTNLYKGDSVKIIMNGWFSHHPENWPPSNQISPLFVAFHINETVKEFNLTNDSIAYFNKNEPIGCRDYNTMNMLKEKGINAYFSGCLTLTLGLTYKHKDIENAPIYIVDPFFNFEKGVFNILKYTKEIILHYKTISKIKRKYQNSIAIPYNNIKSLIVAAAFFNKFKKIIDKKVLENAIYICQEFYDKDFKNDNEKFAKADEILKLYSNAKYVITSRIHCALPCLAMGTPVVFIEKEYDSEFSNCRFGGIIELFNTITINKNGSVVKSFTQEKLSINTVIKNKENFKVYRDALIERCKSFAKDHL